MCLKFEYQYQAFPYRLVKCKTFSPDWSCIVSPSQKVDGWKPLAVTLYSNLNFSQGVLREWLKVKIDTPCQSVLPLISRIIHYTSCRSNSSTSWYHTRLALACAADGCFRHWHIYQFILCLLRAAAINSFSSVKKWTQFHVVRTYPPKLHLWMLKMTCCWKVAFWIFFWTTVAAV